MTPEQDLDAHAPCQALWDALVAEECRVTQSPPARWAEACEEWDAPQGVRCGSFIEDIEHFDAGHFKMSDKEADGMDPHMRLMLEASSGVGVGVGLGPEGWG